VLLVLGRGQGLLPKANQYTYVKIKTESLHKLLMGTGGSFLGLQWPEHDTDNTCPSSAKIETK